MNGPYKFRRFTLTVPSVDNAGRRADHHLTRVRAGLLARGIDGWTETASVGAWRGKIEPGHVLTIYGAMLPQSGAHVLAQVGRDAMPDQDAIQVTAEDLAGTVLLWEG